MPKTPEKLRRICILAALTTLIPFSAAFAENVAKETNASPAPTDAKAKIAQKPEKQDTLEAVEVTAMRFGDSAYASGLFDTNISAEEIERSSLSGITEVLRRYANVNVRNTSGSANSSEISMRGFGSNSMQRVLVLVDGQRLNRLDMSAVNWAQVPLVEISNIEVMSGPQSAIYGNYALAGVIKITTDKWSKKNYAEAGGLYGSYDEYSAYGKLHYADDDIFVNANGNYYHNSGYLSNTLNWSKNASVSGGAMLDSKNEVDFRASFGDEYVEWAKPFYSYSAMVDNPRAGTGKNFENNLNYVTLSAEWENNSAVGMGAAQLGANMRQRDCIYPASPWGNYDYDSRLWTLSFTPHYRLFLGKEDMSYAEAGLDLYYDNFKIDGTSGASPYKSGIWRTTVAPWIAGKAQLTDVFSVSAAGRYEAAFDDVEVKGSGANDADSLTNGLAAQISLNARIDERFNTYFTFAQVYRYPAIDETFSCWGSPYFVYNPDLKPERGQNYEVGVNFANKGLTANANVYFMHLDGEIDYNSASSMNENIGNTDRYGAELKLAYDAEYAGASTAWSYVNAKFADGVNSGKYVPLVPQFITSTMLWVRPVKQFRFDVNFQWASTQYMGSDFANSQAMIHDTWNLDLTANVFVNDRLSVFGAVENVTNELNYIAYDYGYGTHAYYPGIGRVYRCGVKFRF